MEKHPNVSVEEILQNSEFQIRVSRNLKTTKEPTKDELETLRSLDPYKIVLEKRV